MPPKRTPARKARPKGDHAEVAAVLGVTSKRQKTTAAGSGGDGDVLQKSDRVVKGNGVSSELNSISSSSASVSKQHVSTPVTPTLLQQHNQTVLQSLGATVTAPVQQATAAVAPAVPTSTAQPAAPSTPPHSHATSSASQQPQLILPGRKSLFNMAANLKVPDKPYPDIDLPIYPQTDVDKYRSLIDNQRQLDHFYRHSGYYMSPTVSTSQSPTHRKSHTAPRSTFAYASYGSTALHASTTQKNVFSEQPDQAMWLATVPSELLRNTRNLRVKQAPLYGLSLSRRMRKMSTDEGGDADTSKQRRDSITADDDDLIDTVVSDVSGDELDNDDYTAKYQDDDGGESDNDVFNDDNDGDTL